MGGSMHIKHTLRILGTLLAFGMGTIAHAVPVPVPIVPGIADPCTTYPGGLIPTLGCGGGGAAGAAGYILSALIPALQMIFTAVALIMFFYYALRLIVDSEDANTISEVKSAYSYGIAGAAIAGAAGFLVQAVGQGPANSTLIEDAPVAAGLGNLTLYFRLMVSVAVSALVIYQGVRLILLQGQESEIEQQKKRFFYGLIGVAIVLLADTVVGAFFPGTGSVTLVTEIVGITNFLLELLGALAVLAFLAAGFFLVVSTDEGLRDRAKRAMFAAVITLIMVLCSYLIVRFVIEL